MVASCLSLGDISAARRAQAVQPLTRSLQALSSFQAQEIVAAVLDHRSAGVAHQLLDRVLAAQPVAPEDLQGAARHLKGRVVNVTFEATAKCSCEGRFIEL